MEEIAKIPVGAKFAIYGAGEAGFVVKHYIQNDRADLKLVCYFDQVVKGQFDGVNVNHIQDIQSFAKDFDYVIIASFSNSSTMESILNYFDMKNIIRLENIPRASGLLIRQEDRLQKVLDVLSSSESKELFKLIVDSHINSSKNHCLFEFLQKQANDGFNSKGQYYDFVNQESVKTIISGGVFNGWTTQDFLEKFINVEKIYGFEPFYQKVKEDEIDKILKESNKVEIVEKGLSQDEKMTNIVFSGSSSRVISYFSSDETESIETISIDDFVQEQNIKKVDFIKMDIEGSELNALKGAEKTLKNHRPNLAICIYHSYEDLFEIPLYLSSVLTNYNFEVYHYSLINNHESVFYGVPQ